MSKANRHHYRAWNRFKKKMMAVSVIDLLACEVKVMKPSGEQMRRAWPLCDVDLIQSTGLTDMHGREGFKGSVFRLTLGRHYWVYEVIDFPELTGGNLYAVCREHNVSYSEDGDTYTYKTVRPKVVIRDCISKIKRGTIIGNIHENPELLEANNE